MTLFRVTKLLDVDPPTGIGQDLDLDLDALSLVPSNNGVHGIDIIILENKIK